jgi:dihydrolipoamide dehydrogenase
MVVGNVPEAVDFLVVGAGPGHKGRRVTLIDRDGEDGVGGACLRVGCIPSKALIEAADLYHRIGAAGPMGVSAVRDTFDMTQFQTWRTEVVGNLTNGVRSLLRASGVEVIAGIASFADQRTVIVNTPDDQVKFLQFTDVVVATGSSPKCLPNMAFDGAMIIDSTDALQLNELPPRLAVAGAGYIGLELGIAFAKLGAQVTILEAADRVLPAMDAGLAPVVSRRLEELGITTLLDTFVDGCEDGLVRYHCATSTHDRGDTDTLPCDALLVATGRSPNTDTLGIEHFGVELTARGTIPVDPDRRFAPHAAAIGDITDGPALAHKASSEALVAVEALCGEASAFSPLAIPCVVFSDPEIAVAGLEPEAAQRAGFETDIHRIPLTVIGRAATLGERNGFAQIVSDRDDGSVLGVQLVGPHASELIGEGTLAIEMGSTIEDLALTIHAHPTLSEQYAEIGHLATGQPLHVATRRVK